MVYEVAAYAPHELTQTIADDPWAVRDEALSRHNVLTRRIATARRNLARMEAQAAEYRTLFDTAARHIARL